jgi:hypothetical protein
MSRAPAAPCEGRTFQTWRNLARQTAFPFHSLLAALSELAEVGTLYNVSNPKPWHRQDRNKFLFNMKRET